MKKELSAAGQAQNIKDIIIAEKKAEEASKELQTASEVLSVKDDDKKPSRKERKKRDKDTKARRKAEQNTANAKIREERKSSEIHYF